MGLRAAPGAAEAIGARVKGRAELGEEGKQVASAREARNQWIRAINTVAVVLEMVGVDEKGILGRIRDAERDAERRRPRGPRRPTRIAVTDVSDPADPPAPEPGPEPTE